MSSLTLAFFWAFGSMLSLSAVSEIFLAHRDRFYLQRLAEVLTVKIIDREPSQR